MGKNSEIITTVIGVVLVVGAGLAGSYSTAVTLVGAVIAGTGMYSIIKGKV